uniref:Zinc finger protein 414 n=1 Tax=Oryzias latipes TaxID=8090 RepID=H2L3A7_ORYLA
MGPERCAGRPHGAGAVRGAAPWGRSGARGGPMGPERCAGRPHGAGAVRGAAPWGRSGARGGPMGREPLWDGEAASWGLLNLYFSYFHVDSKKNRHGSSSGKHTCEAPGAHVCDACGVLTGKVLLCSTVGCSASFPSMQKLMVHTRLHHKPNIYFQCESCRTKLRSYRNLLGHLCVPAAFLSGPTDPPMLDPPVLPLQEISPPNHPPTQLRETASPVPSESYYSLPPTLKPVTPKAVVDPPDLQSQVQTQTWTSEATHPVSLPAVSSHGSPAVWRKSQGEALLLKQPVCLQLILSHFTLMFDSLGCSRRVLWEHTRGCYTCVQCGHRATNRKEMSEHISSNHSGSRAAENRTTPPVLHAVSAPPKRPEEAGGSDAGK